MASESQSVWGLVSSHLLERQLTGLPAHPRTGVGESGAPTTAFGSMTGTLRLQGKACSEALFGNTSGLNCTDVDWTACDVAHKLPGLVPFTVELYRKGSVTFFGC